MRKYLTDYLFILDIVFLLLIYTVVLSSLKIEGLFKDTIPTGGDLIYHFANYIDFKEVLIPNWQITGWTDASYGGTNIFQNYPIFSFILIYLFDIFLSTGTAFKMVVMGGTIGLPLAIYWMLSQSKVPRPGPIMGAVLSLAYLFHDNHSAFGGNLQSVFAGEFAHSLSILFLVIFCGFLLKAFEERKYTVHAIIALSIAGFSHPTSFAVGIFLPLVFLVQDNREDTGYTSSRTLVSCKIIIISSLLFCIWSIGYLVSKNYSGIAISDIVTKSYGWSFIKMQELVPYLLSPFAIIFLIIIVYLLFFGKKIPKPQAIWLLGGLISMVFYLTKFMWFGIRFLPLLYLFILLFVASSLGHGYQHGSKRIKILLYSSVIFCFIGIYSYAVNNNLFEKYRGQSSGIFIGTEKKSDWESITLIANLISTNFDTQTGDYKNTKYPPRIFSVNKGDTFRTLSHASLYDSLFSGSLSKIQGKWTSQQINYKKINPENIWSYMELNNVKIIIATRDLANYLKNTPYFSQKQVFDYYTLFEVKNITGDYVVPLKKQVYKISSINQWEKINNLWYTNYLQTYLGEQENSFIVYDPKKENQLFEAYDPEKIDNNNYVGDCSVKEFITRGKIDINTSCIGKPLLIKFTYNPNWKVIGAKDVYRASANFMIVVPEKNHVTVYYGKKIYNYISYICGILGIFLLFSHNYIETMFLAWAQSIYKKHKKIFKKMQFIMQKIHIQAIGRMLGKESSSILLILILLSSVAFFYTIK